MLSRKLEKSAEDYATVNNGSRDSTKTKSALQADWHAGYLRII